MILSDNLCSSYYCVTSGSASLRQERIGDTTLAAKKASLAAKLSQSGLKVDPRLVGILKGPARTLSKALLAL